MFLPEKQHVAALYTKVVLKLHHVLCDVLEATLQQHTFDTKHIYYKIKIFLPMFNVQVMCEGKMFFTCF